MIDGARTNRLPAPRFHLGRILLVLIWIVALAWAAILWPAQWGGRAWHLDTRGHSMEPSYHGGDYLLIYGAQGYRVGDVVAYRHADDSIIFHRIIKMRADGYILKGDNNDAPDADLVVPEQILGRQTLHVRGWGWLLGTPVVALLFPVLVAIWARPLRHLSITEHPGT